MKPTKPKSAPLERAYAEHLAQKLWDNLEEERLLGEPKKLFEEKVINSIAGRFEMLYNRGRRDEAAAPPPGETTP